MGGWGGGIRNIWMQKLKHLQDSCPSKTHHHFYMHAVFIVSHHLFLHIVVNTATTSAWILHLANAALRQTTWTSLLAQGKILIGPVSIMCLSLNQSIEAKGGGHIYCSHSHPILSLLLFCGPHSTHHELKLTHLYCLSSWLPQKVHSDLFTTKTILQHVRAAQ